MPSLQTKLSNILAWKADKPSSDVEWAEDVKAESLHLKFDDQLAQMRDMHQDKAAVAQKRLFWITTYPDATRQALHEEYERSIDEGGQGLEGQALLDAIEDELAQRQESATWKLEKLLQSVVRIEKEIDLRDRAVVEREPKGTTYYIDADNGHDTNNDGTTPTKSNGDGPWKTFDQFCENARSAGDKAICRGSMTNRYDNATDLVMASSGVINNPIILEADYDDSWGDHVDISGTATATLTFGSKTITFTADVSGVISVGDFIFVTAEDAREFAYEVKSVVTTTVTLYLPYKGDQAGSGKAMTNMGSPPIWNTAAGDYQIMFDNDHWWKLQGLHLRGADTNGVVEIDGSTGSVLKDCVLEGNGYGTTSYCVKATDNIARLELLKGRLVGFDYALGAVGGFYIGRAKDCLFEQPSLQAYLMYVSVGDDFLFEECECVNIQYLNFISSVGGGGRVRLRNVIGTPLLWNIYTATNRFHQAFQEDRSAVVSDTRYESGLMDAYDDELRQSETSILRTGGGNISIKVTPSTKIERHEFSKLLLFEYPIYATTAEKTYTVYFRPSATGDWTADPTADELWIEIEYWADATNKHRRIVKSTGTIDMNGSTNWQSLSVTATPTLAGVAYLRCWYGKAKEVGKSNVFYCDPIPEIT